MIEEGTVLVTFAVDRATHQPTVSSNLLPNESPAVTAAIIRLLQGVASELTTQALLQPVQEGDKDEKGEKKNS